MEKLINHYITQKKHNKYLKQQHNYKFNNSIGEFVERYKKEDRLDDDYEEIIKTLDGKIIYYCYEPLSCHRNHGNAKKRRKINEI